MRKLLLALLLLGTLTAAAQGFISYQARLAKKQYEQKTAKARARGEAADENARMQLFVTSPRMPMPVRWPTPQGRQEPR